MTGRYGACPAGGRHTYTPDDDSAGERCAECGAGPGLIDSGAYSIGAYGDAEPTLGRSVLASESERTEW